MKPIRFLHISDTHLGPDKYFIQHKVNTYEAFSQFLKAVKTLPFTPDFIVHTGDITADCYEEGYRLVASMIQDLKIPMYFVTGHHDTSKLIKSYLPMRHIQVLSEKLNCYRFSFGDNHFLTVDGRGHDEIDPHGVINTEQMDILKKELKAGKMLTLFIHFSPIPYDSTWFDQNMLLTNGQEFHELLVAHKRQIRGVFFGHIHRSTQIFQDGILYSGVGSTSIQFIVHPWQKMPIFESIGYGYFNIVTLEKNRITIKESSFGNGQEIFIQTK